MNTDFVWKFKIYLAVAWVADKSQLPVDETDEEGRVEFKDVALE